MEGRGGVVAEQTERTRTSAWEPPVSGEGDLSWSGGGGLGGLFGGEELDQEGED